MRLASSLYVSSSAACTCDSRLNFALVQILQAEPFEALKPTLETLLANKDKNKQRGAAELLAGIVCGQYCHVFIVICKVDH